MHTASTWISTRRTAISRPSSQVDPLTLFTAMLRLRNCANLGAKQRVLTPTHRCGAVVPPRQNPVHRCAHSLPERTTSSDGHIDCKLLGVVLLAPLLSPQAALAAEDQSEVVITVLFTLVVVLLATLTAGVAYLSIKQWLDSRQEKEDRERSSKPVVASLAGSQTSAGQDQPKQKVKREKKGFGQF